MFGDRSRCERRESRFVASRLARSCARSTRADCVSRSRWSLRHTHGATTACTRRIYSAAGDGYFESTSRGLVGSPEDGLKHRYLVELRWIRRSGCVIVSATDGPGSAYRRDRPRRTYIGRLAQRWESNERPAESKGTTATRSPLMLVNQASSTRQQSRRLKSDDAGRSGRLSTSLGRAGLADGVVALACLPE